MAIRIRPLSKTEMQAAMKQSPGAKAARAVKSLVPAPEHQVLNRPGRKPDPNAKQLLTLRLDPDVIAYFRSTGEGWQTRMNEALRKAAAL